jgi:ATP-dependent DNA helicase RecQ
VADVLTGAATGRIGQLAHDRLEAYAALRGERKSQVRAWIDQLTAQGHLARSDEEYPTLLLTERGRQALRGEIRPAPLTTAGRTPRAAAPAPARRDAPPRGAERAAGTSDAALFEMLRALRRRVAEERGVPPYLIFSDASLRDMARLRPLALEQLREVMGVGDWKLATFGQRFLAALREVLGGD